jgi:serine phosphatase RsbU (regulator of sigma subunit)
MLELKDFIHLPALDPLIGKLLADDAGLMVVAGLDPRPEISEAAGVPGSGRTTIFRILVRQALESQPGMRALVVTAERGSMRLPRQLRHRVEEHVVPSRVEMVETVEAIAAVGGGSQRTLLVIDHLGEGMVGPVLAAARAGRHILAQLETVWRGAAVVRELVEMGATPADLDGLHWVLAVQRLPALCTHCRGEVEPVEAELAALGRRWAEPLSGPFYRAAGCDACQRSGRQDTIAAFDLYCRHDPACNLPLEEYLSHLAREGHLSLDDLLYVEADETRRNYQLFAASERALAEVRTTMQVQLAELESAYRVAQQRTEALVSLQTVGEALATTGNLRAVAHQICVQACDLSGGDYALLYLLHTPTEAEVLASHGWDLARIESPVELVVEVAGERPFEELPPGIGPLRPGVRAANIRGGHFLPLVKQGEPIGALIVQTGRKNRFAPGEVSLLRGLASLAVVALQRAGLIEELRQKMAALEAAHEGLAQKERMARELELARAVQQRMLPRAFPEIAGYAFASTYRPAREVGGDFYDAFVIDEDHFAVAVGDVSDKGMPAALYMALTRSLLRAEGSRTRSPQATLARVNQLLIELGERDMFVTVFYGVVARSSRQLTYCRAGHDRPFLLRDGDVSELHGKGMALGVVGAGRLALAEETVQLAPGDRLLLYSDGLSDVQSPDGEFFEKERLAALVAAQSAVQGAAPGELCWMIFDALTDFQGEAAQFDDMALLVLGVM